jgi:hypothetical protein
MSNDTQRDDYAWPEAGDMQSILRSRDFYTRSWAVAHGKKISEHNPLPSIERALSGLCIVTNLLDADEEARNDGVDSVCEPSHLSRQHRWQLLNAQRVLLDAAHGALCEWREKFETRAQKEEPSHG